MTAKRIACIGEGMIELSQLDLAGGSARIGFAGDTWNTAVYLARLGTPVAYLTVLGTDAFSDRMRERLTEEGVDATLAGRHESRLPGIYSIETDAAGERSFRYWREASAARTLFSGGPGPSLDDLDGFDAVYLSGITLAILPAAVRDRLSAKLASLAAAGRMVAFDGNHRPRLWPDADTARAAQDAGWRAATLALPSFDDEALLHRGLTPPAALDRIAALGPAEIALKNGAAGPLVRADGHDLRPDLPPAPRVVDTSGAGDSFNAGYLAARLRGEPAAAAAAAGHALACRVVGHHGAVIPLAAMTGD